MTSNSYLISKRIYRGQGQVGFTLIEVLMVIVILGLVASIGSSYVVSALNSYRDAQVRDQLVQRGRLVMEQMARELRMAAPNSVRISSSGNCVEFLPVFASTRYNDNVPTVDNNAPESSTIGVAEYSIGSHIPKHALVAPYFIAEIYTLGNPATRASLAAYAPGDYTQVDLLNAHRFTRGSLSKRLFLTGDPVRFCVSPQGLQRIAGYGFFTSALTDVPPAGTVDLMSQNVAPEGTAFSLTAGSENRHTAVIVSLLFSLDSSSVDLQHQVLIRNVP